mgnify:CR=1 FL=1
MEMENIQKIGFDLFTFQYGSTLMNHLYYALILLLEFTFQYGSTLIINFLFH